MVAPESAVDIREEDLSGPGVVLSSQRAMGNGVFETIQDVVFTKPGAFDAKFSRTMALEIEKANRTLLGEGRPYLLIGFGRWGSSDPWLGIPVNWSQVSGAKVMVEATLPTMNVEPSQGSHFFHNLSSFEVCYFTVGHGIGGGIIDWNWLEKQDTVSETEFLRHIRPANPLRIRVDGRSGRGVAQIPQAHDGSFPPPEGGLVS
jgi:hypothetical protein